MDKIVVIGEVPTTVVEIIRKNYPLLENSNNEDLVSALLELLADGKSPDMIVLGDHVRIGELRLPTEALRPVFKRLAEIHSTTLYLGHDSGQLISWPGKGVNQ